MEMDEATVRTSPAGRRGALAEVRAGQKWRARNIAGTRLRELQLSLELPLK